MENQTEQTNLNTETETEQTNAGTETKVDKLEDKINNIDYLKLEEIINKGIQVKENGILKSYLSQQGLNEDEMKEAINSYKENKASKNKDEEITTLKLKEELELMKQEIKNKELNESVNEFGINNNVSKKGLKALIKLSDLNNEEIFDEKGKIKSSKLEEKLKATLEEYPEFKEKQETKTEKKTDIKTETPNKDKKNDNELLRKIMLGK